MVVAVHPGHGDNMSATDFIHIRGGDKLTGELFQSLCCASTANGGTPGTTPGTIPTVPPPILPADFSKALWDAQTSLISSQSEFIRRIKGMFAQRLENLPELTSKSDFLKNLFSFLFGVAVELYTESMLISNIAQYVFGLVWDGVDGLKKFFTHYDKFLDLMIEENKNLLLVEKSHDNYVMRRQALADNYAAIKQAMDIVDALSSQIIAIGGKIPNMWGEWIKKMDVLRSDVHTWIDDSYKLSDTFAPTPGQLYPVIPDPPDVPALPTLAGNDAQIALLGEYMRNNLVLQLQKLKYDIEHHQDIKQSLDALANVDATLDFGTVRYHLKGQAITY